MLGRGNLSSKKVSYRETGGRENCKRNLPQGKGNWCLGHLFDLDPRITITSNLVISHWKDQSYHGFSCREIEKLKEELKVRRESEDQMKQVHIYIL